MTDPLEIPIRPSLSARKEDHAVIIEQDSRGPDPEEHPWLCLSLDDAAALRDWLIMALKEPGA